MKGYERKDPSGGIQVEGSDRMVLCGRIRVKGSERKNPSKGIRVKQSLGMEMANVSQSQKYDNFLRGSKISRNCKKSAVKLQ